jgi:hypothetical protein
VNNQLNQGKIKTMNEPIKLIRPITRKIMELAKDAPAVEHRIYYEGVLDGMKIVSDLWRQDLKQEEASGQQTKGPSSAELLENALKALAAPKRRIAERDETGNIIASVEHPLL